MVLHSYRGRVGRSLGGGPAWRAAVIAALLLAGPLAGEGRGNFFLTGSEHIDVTTEHYMGELSDSSTADVWEGGSIERAMVLDQARLRVMGYGHTERPYSVYHLYAMASLEIVGGRVMVEIVGGRVRDLTASRSSVVDISGGLVEHLLAGSLSVVHVSGGKVNSLSAAWSSAVDISGGSVSYLGALDSSTTTFYGRDFHLGPGLTLDGERILGTGVLSGDWFDGTPWTTEITQHDSGATILLVPEPATLSLLALGLALLAVRSALRADDIQLRTLW